MNDTTATYRVFPLGDSAFTIDFGNFIDISVNKKVISLFNYLQKEKLENILEVVPAYSSLTIYYDVLGIKKKYPGQRACELMKKTLEEILLKNIPGENDASTVTRIPVLYDGEDLLFISQEKNITVDEIIQIHSATNYRVYMLGFLPGFAYMGEVDERIAAPRKQQPRLKVEAGSVGIAGKQTGIYPSASPGGWQIIGRTPLKLFDATKENPTLLKAGDMVQFYSITKDEFKNR
ncbi:MAG: 5-oxoprolinase subunit PxpB [Chitinophagaceae bacterium]